MKKTAKLLTVLLAVVMVLTAMASCGTTPAETTPEETTKAPGTPAASTPKAPSTTKAPDATDDPDATGDVTPEASESESETDPVDLESLLPEQIELGVDMTVLTGYLYYDEWLDADDGEIVGTELYNRVPRVSNRLGITLNVEKIQGTNESVYKEEVKKRHESTDPNMIADATSGYSQFIGALTLEGRFQNMANSDNIDFENPGWPADLIENSVIDDKIYFVSGDISPTLLYEIYAIFFNRQLVDRYNIEDPIALVNNYEWTIDKLIALTSDIYEDLDNANPGPSSGDFFAFNINDAAHYKALPFAMGVRVIVPDDVDGYVYSELYTGDRMEIIADKVSNWIINNPGVHAASEGFKDYCTGFINGNIIFNLGNFANGSHYFAGTGVDYGVVPCPLYDEEQEEYYSYYGNPTSFWAIPTNTDIDNAAALIEYLAADAYVYISPALFERALKIKYVTGEVDGLSKMFDIIRDGVIFDPCMFYNQAIGNGAYNGFTAIATDISSWSALFDRFTLKAMKNTLKNDVVARLRALEY